MRNVRIKNKVWTVTISLNRRLITACKKARCGAATLARPFSLVVPMKIEMRKLSDIRPYENNPRLNDAGVDAVAASIREFGFRQPIVVDEQSIIVVGHTRV